MEKAQVNQNELGHVDALLGRFGAENFMIISMKDAGYMILFVSADSTNNNTELIGQRAITTNAGTMGTD
jgi:hypothetical protein